MPHLGVVNMISRGPSAGRETKSRRRKYVQELKGEKPLVKKVKQGSALMFTDDDLGSVITPHDDPLLIEARISGYLVKKILIDTRSSTEILFLKAFRKMGLNIDSLRP